MSAQDLEQRARELLAAEYERGRLYDTAERIRRHDPLPAGWQDDCIAIRAIIAALRQQPAPAELSEVTRQLIERDRRGRAKYGTSLDRTDLSLPDWLQHMAEELLDAAGYALAAKRTAHQPAPVVDDAMRELIQKWRKLAEQHGVRTFTGNDHALFANELEAALARAQGVQS